MPLDRLPADILISLVKDYGILHKADILHLVLTCKGLYGGLRPFLFTDLAYGYITDHEYDELLPILRLHGFGDFPGPSSKEADKIDHDVSLLRSLREGWITENELCKVRELRLFSDVGLLNERHISVIAFLENLKLDRLGGVNYIVLYLLKGVGTPNISSEITHCMNSVFELLGQLPAPVIRLKLVTDTFQSLEALSKIPNLALDTLFIDATTSNREEIEQWQEGIKQFTELTSLSYKGMSPWATGYDEIGIIGLCDDFPSLKVLRMICSPNFTSLPRSVHEVHIDIGERDQIVHHCFPLITTLPNLRVLWALNRQNTLPRYHGNPMQTVRLPGTEFTTLRVLHAEMPRPDEKLMFFPPGVLETIANCNPHLEEIFLPFLSSADALHLATTDCTKTLRSLEIQSSICRTITRESSFDVSHLANLFSGPGLPNLELMRWSCGGKREMAINEDLVEAMFPKAPSTVRRHNLQIVALESRLPKPQSPYVYSGLLNWEELVNHRKGLKMACVDDTSKEADLDRFIKPVFFTVDGVAEEEVSADLEFPYERPSTMVVKHQNLTPRETRYLRDWRSSGGSLGIIFDGPNSGTVQDFRKSVWEELYFVDLERMRLSQALEGEHQRISD